MTTTSVDMVDLFIGAKKDLEKNRGELNNVDKLDGDHGNNMVENFDIITEAMKEKPQSKPSTKLNHASKSLRKRTSEISGLMLSDGLKRAAKKFRGKKTLNREDAVLLTYLLLGVAADTSKEKKCLITRFFDWLFCKSDEKLDSKDLETLLDAGLTFLNANQSGKNTLDSLVDSIIAASSMGTSSDHRMVSSKLVSSSFMKNIK